MDNPSDNVPVTSVLPPYSDVRGHPASLVTSGRRGRGHLNPYPTPKQAHSGSSPDRDDSLWFSSRFLSARGGGRGEKDGGPTVWRWPDSGRSDGVLDYLSDVP